MLNFFKRSNDKPTEEPKPVIEPKPVVDIKPVVESKPIIIAAKPIVTPSDGNLNSDQIAKIKTKIIKEFPDFKFSVRKLDYGYGMKISILSGTVDFGIDFVNVNRYRINDDYTGDAQDVLNRINEIASEHYVYIVRDLMFGYQSNYYINITIGDITKGKDYDYLNKAYTIIPYEYITK